MRVAHDAAQAVVPGYRNKFSRHDFTLAQLFACLVVREMMNKGRKKGTSLITDDARMSKRAEYRNRDVSRY